MDIVEKLKSAHSFHGDPLHREAWEEIERLQEEVNELEGIMDEEKCAVGYLITKRALKKHGMWKLTNNK